MDYLFTPWRYAYIAAADTGSRPGVPQALAAWPGNTGCVFCNLLASVDYAIEHGMSRDQADSAAGLVHRARHSFVMLNAFPYTSGHVMIVPFAHLNQLSKLPAEAAHEIMDLTQQTEHILDRLYHPDGFNFGLNIGKAAGAGIAGHLHLHAMPRWFGDTNFMTTVAETRLVPEDLSTAWQRLRQAFSE